MSQKARPTFRKRIQEISYSRYPRDVFESFCRLAACTLSCGQREEQYLAEAKRWTSEELTGLSECLGLLVLEMEERPFCDLLGPEYMELQSGKSAQFRGEFYTPPEISKLMAMMTGIPEIPLHRPIMIGEPACGSGGMILAFAEQMVAAGYSPLNMRAVCTDVATVACDMCFINLTLWGIPALVQHGNTLSGEVWNSYYNPLWNKACGRGGLLYSQLATALGLHDEDEEPENEPEPEPVKSAPMEQGQFTFDFAL